MVIPQKILILYKNITTVCVKTRKRDSNQIISNIKEGISK